MSTTTRAILGAALAAAVCAVPVGLAAASPSGAAFTTDASGTAVNENHYSSPDDVYLNGGPSCHAPRHAASLPDGRFYFRVTTPNGKADLSAAAGVPLSRRSFTVDDGRVVSSAAPSSFSECADGLVVQVGPFAESPNGVYKLAIVPASAPSFATFPARSTKTDNFSVDPSDGGGDGGGGGGGGSF
jgi:hypothetical protein